MKRKGKIFYIHALRLIVEGGERGWSRAVVLLFINLGTRWR
jgi:hypothetical protein